MRVLRNLAAVCILAAAAPTQVAKTHGGMQSVEPGIHDAAQKGDLQRVKALLASDPTLVDAEKPPNAKTPLHYAAQGGHTDVVALLLDTGAKVNRPNIAGETALHYAVGLDNPEVVNLLLARGADVKAKTTDGTTPLRMAAAWGALPSITALLEKGADPRETLPNGDTLLHVAALVGPVQAIDLFVARGVGLNALNDGGATPLLVACAGGKVETAMALLERGADPNLRDGLGRQPLVLAARAGQTDLVKRMLDAGAKVTEGSTPDGRSALHVAAAVGSGSIVNLLLAGGADRDARDSHGRTPLDLAALYGNAEIAATLRGGQGKAGAGVKAPVRALSARPPNHGEAVVWYLNHSGWAVRTRRHLLVFDYARAAGLPDQPSLANGMLVPGEIKDIPTTVFVTHDHRDHYMPAVFDLKGSVRQVVYVAGFKPEGKDGYLEMAARETKGLGDLEVTAIQSTDAGVGFFVRADGVTIFHGGDHCNAEGEASGPFRREVDFLAESGRKADLYFAAVRGCGHPEGIRNGVYYAIERLSAKAVFPMHGGGRESAYADFAREAARAGVSVPFYCAEFGGDHFTISSVSRPPVPAPAAAPPAAELAEVLRRAGEGVVRHARESTVILADERCQQSAYAEAAGYMPRVATERTAQRRWKAELALVQLPEAGQPAVPWMEIRDVVEVDGHPLPERRARLERMTRADPNWTTSRARQIVEENARFNIGPVRRTINTPTIPLLVLYPSNQGRFTFSKAGEQKVGAVGAWKVAFRETQRPTLVRAAGTGSDMPSAGTFWIDPGTGEVVRAELQCGALAESRLTVTYRRHPTFGLSLPVEMIEKATGDEGQWVDGKCGYSNFRRFETSGRMVVPR